MGRGRRALLGILRRVRRWHATGLFAPLMCLLASKGPFGSRTCIHCHPIRYCSMQDSAGPVLTMLETKFFRAADLVAPVKL